MFLILEVILTTVAWLKGWKWKSLIPLVGGFVLAFLFGLIMGSIFGNSLPIIFIKIVGFLVDLAIIITLIIMIYESPSKKNKTK